jgi:hypothetical protein
MGRDNRGARVCQGGCIKHPVPRLRCLMNGLFYSHSTFAEGLYEDFPLDFDTPPTSFFGELAISLIPHPSAVATNVSPSDSWILAIPPFPATN